jgi:trk/ktr system potassium uptake protein
VDSSTERLRPLDPLRRRVALSGHVAGVVWTVAGAAMLVCAAVALLSDGEDVAVFVAGGVVVGAAGLVLRRFTTVPVQASTVQLFRAVVAGALFAIVAAAVPYILTGAVGRWDDAVVEAVSGVTTTGATVIVHPESLGRGLLLWRAMTQWLGAAGVILLVVSVFPYLGIGGFDPDGGVATRSGRRLSPRFAASLRKLALAYVAITGAGAVAYFAAGMGGFDAVAHAMTTASTGGFSTRTGSIAAFGSASIEWAAIAGMLAGGTSFPLLWRFVVRREKAALLRSYEFKVYAGFVLLLALAVLIGNAAKTGYDLDAIRSALFVSASAISTTGFTTGELFLLDPGTEALLVLAMGIGAMAASVAGGLKIVRLLAVVGYVRRELVRLLHPRLEAAIRIGPSTLSDEATARMLGSVTLSLAIVVAACLGVAATGADLMTSISAVVASFSTGGPALVEGQNTTYLASLEPAARWVLSALMVLGRVEVFPVLMVAGEAFSHLSRRVRPGRRRRRLLVG